MKLKTFAFISFSVLFLVFTGCSGGVGNNAPVIENLYAEPDEVEKGQETTLFCLATDPEGGNLNYEWNKEIIEPPSDSEEDDDGEEDAPPEDERILSPDLKSLGIINGIGKTVTWTAPDTPGTYEINCVVSDGNMETISSLTVTVFDPQGGTAKGEINGASPLTNSYTLETWYTTSVEIENTSSSKRTFKIKAEESSDVQFEETEKNITLAAGATLEVPFDYQFLGSLNSKKLTFNLYHDYSILLDTFTTSPIEPYQEPEEEEEENPLSPPTGVSASDGTEGLYTYITWNSVSGATHYKVYRATSASGPKTALGNWQIGTDYLDWDAAPYVIYYYWVKAATSSSGDNASDYSNYDTGYSYRNEYDEIENVINGFYQAVSDKDWNKARSYCIYGSEPYEFVNAIENEFYDAIEFYGDSFDFNMPVDNISTITLTGEYYEYANAYVCTAIITSVASVVIYESSDCATHYLQKVNTSWKLY